MRFKTVVFCLVQAAMQIDLSYRPNVLYLASIERMATARRVIDQKPNDYVLASYLAGLAVECILQALALHSGAAHDARHSLANWLSKCPPALHDSLKGSADWNLLVALWDNGLRYLAYNALLGYFRHKEYLHGKKGGAESLVRLATKRLVDAAEVVHKKGLAVWHAFWQSRQPRAHG
jgi:hypothetical protein